MFRRQRGYTNLLLRHGRRILPHRYFGPRYGNNNIKASLVTTVTTMTTTTTTTTTHSYYKIYPKKSFTKSPPIWMLRVYCDCDASIRGGMPWRRVIKPDGVRYVYNCGTTRHTSARKQEHCNNNNKQTLLAPVLAVLSTMNKHVYKPIA